MKKDELLDHLGYALKSVLCKGLEGIDSIAMESNVDLFILKEASRYTSEELIEKFYTPEMSINIFMEFLANAGGLEDSGNNTIQ